MKIHQVLTNETLPYEFYLSIVSALEIHKPEEYVLWVVRPLEDTDPYFSHIKDRITLREIDFSFVEGCQSFDDWKNLPVFVGRDENFIEVHLKDLLGWKILFEEGGLFMDLDTLSIQDCTSFFDACKNAHFFKHGLPHPDAFNVAVMIAQPQSVLMFELYEYAMNVIQGDSPIEWGDTGPTMLNNIVKKYLPDDEETILSFTKECCIVDGNGMGKIREWLSEDGFVWDRCRILHIYRSCEYTKQRMETTLLDESFIYRSRSPYASLVKEVLPVSAWNPNNVLQPPKTVRRRKTFHLPCLPHLPANKKDGLSCAYTQKTIKLASMLMSLGHKVIVYGLEGSEVECTEFVQVATKYELLQTYGERTDTNQYHPLEHGAVHESFYANAIRGINIRKKPNDYLLCTFGWGQKPIADGVQLPLTVESGIGYTDTFTRFRVFESYAWMHYVYGLAKQDDGSNYDCVIPNYFDPEDFQFSKKKKNYILYLGRLIGRKGIEIAIQLAEHTKTKLLVAGQDCGENIKLDRLYVEYVGYAGVEKRRELLRDAKALLVPTIYIGPFEGVHVEAWFSGTPVITSDWGVFGETVLHGKTGFRCRTFEQYIWAVNNIDRIDPADCHEYAMQNYTMDRVKYMYEEYFDMIGDIVGGKGWYELRPDRGEYDAWTRYFPQENNES